MIRFDHLIANCDEGSQLPYATVLNGAHAGTYCLDALQTMTSPLPLNLASRDLPDTASCYDTAGLSCLTRKPASGSCPAAPTLFRWDRSLARAKRSSVR
jgi:hypothetical protein